MRLEKKTTATILAAILIAIAGVTPALADNPVEVAMTVTVTELEIISISVTPASILFPEVLQGGVTEAPEAVVITNQGNVYVTIDAYVIGSDTDATVFYEDYLYTSDEFYPTDWVSITLWDKLNHIHPVASYESINLKIDMGGDVPVWGTYSATLVFFAEYEGPG